MKRSSKLRAIGVAAALAVGIAATVAVAVPDPGFKTSRPAQLVALETGVQLDPILSTGDIVGGYQMSGIPDGLGAYKDKGNLEVLMNHELSGSAPAGVGARVSFLTLNRKTLGVLGASYVVDGTEGYSRFCSSTLAVVNGTPWYFTGEESTATGALTPDPSDGIGHGGISVAINAETGEVIETPQFGHLEFENVVPVERLNVAMVLGAEDGDAGKSQLYAYTAPTFQDAIAGNGQLWVWKTTKAVDDANPSTDDIVKGETIPGEFVPISQSDNDDAAELEAAAQVAGAFDFVRVEDAAGAPPRAGRRLSRGSPLRAADRHRHDRSDHRGAQP